MKVGILTLPLEANYGGILQNWALQTILTRMGHNVVTFQKIETRHHLPIVMPLIWTLRLIRKSLGRKDIVIFPDRHYKRIKEKRAGAIENFKKKKINLYPIKSVSDIPIEQYDTIIVGSDQIWRKKFFETMWNSDIVTNAFLSTFINSSVKRISYAASFGLNDWQFDEKDTKIIIKSLDRFDAISVREISGVPLLNDICGIKAQNVCDPTLLLTAEDYISLLDLKIKKNIGIVSYILDHTDFSKHLISQFIQKKKLAHTELHSIREDGTIPSIEEWLTYIASADMVITDSFHGCMFSIIFRKPLVFIGNENRGNARFDTIIEKFNLLNNLVSSENTIDTDKSYSLPSNIEENIKLYREKSMEFLSNNLKTRLT